ncbi:VOC family protein [Streptomyces sp. NBC_00178]|uniref:VOC family protein n=1 Tax=Streptomyces sp. NBC_00178 TaxID=2975672 RepID=UPI002E282BB8|nr:VOC family protein [Streptomyces sp. NBC_00178]
MSQTVDRQDGSPAPGPVLSPEALFHTGLVVEDLDLAMKALTELAGYRWTSVMELQVTARTPGGLQHGDQRFVLSLEEPRLELVEAIPGTVWVSDGSNGAHHVGYWAENDRIEATSAALVELGFEVEASNDTEADGTLMWVYHRGLGGLRVELLNTLMKPSMDAWIAGADPAEVQQDAPVG